MQSLKTQDHIKIRKKHTEKINVNINFTKFPTKDIDSLKSFAIKC